MGAELTGSKSVESEMTYHVVHSGGIDVAGYTEEAISPELPERS